jgi:fibronectin-binding autotransporter adhesin
MSTKQRKNLRSSRRRAFILGGSVAALFSYGVHAANETWNGGSLVNGLWSDLSDWVGGAPPGSTSSTTDTDVATFNAAIANTWGNSAGNPIVIDSTTQNIGGINFDTASGNYFIGSTGGHTLLLSSGGTIQILSSLTATNAIETINAPLQIQGANGTYTFANNSTGGIGAKAGTLKIGGGITGGAAGATVLTLSGSNDNLNTISGIIANGSATTLSVTKAGNSTWVLSGANTYTGPTTVTEGTLLAGVASVANVSGAFGNNSAVIIATTGEANLNLNGFNTQIGSLTGGSSNAGMVALGSSTLTVGGDNSSPAAYAGVILGSPGKLIKIGTGVQMLSGANNYTGGNTVSAGTLDFLNTTAKPTSGTTTVAAGATLGLGVATSGAFFTSANVDSLFAGTLALVTNNATSNVGIDTTQASFTYASSVPSTTRGLTKLGPNTLTLTGTNSYTGTTTIIAGTLSVGLTANLGAPAANLVFNGGTLQITGTTLTNFSGLGHTVSFTAGQTVGLDINNLANTFTADQVLNQTSGGLTKLGAGTLVLNQTDTYTGPTTLSAGTLVLDYTASDTTKLSNALFTLGNATLQLDRAGAAAGTHLEIVASTTLSGVATINQGAGSSAVLQMGAITRNAGATVNFGAASIATTSTTNTNGILGVGWATIGGTDWATNSTNTTNGPITAYTGYTDVTRLNSGPQVIADGSTINVRIIDGTGSAANLTLGAATTTINTLNQSATGGPATIDPAGRTLAVNCILVGAGAGALNLGAGTSNGTLMAVSAGGELILQNYSANTPQSLARGSD